MIDAMFASVTLRIQPYGVAPGGAAPYDAGAVWALAAMQDGCTEAEAIEKVERDA